MTALTEHDLVELQRFTLKIEDREFTNWSEVELEQSLDCVSIASFTAPFEPDRKDFRELFRPFTFPKIEVFVGGVIRFTGRIVDISPTSNPNAKTVKVQCYAMPATLADCALPWNPKSGDQTHFETNGLMLEQVAAQLCMPFGIGVRYDARAKAALKSKGGSRG